MLIFSIAALNSGSVLVLMLIFSIARQLVLLLLGKTDLETSNEAKVLLLLG